MNNIKVVRNNFQLNYTFSKVPETHLFEYEGKIYMKLLFVYHVKDSGETYNSMCIADLVSQQGSSVGYYKNFTADQIVIPLKCTLTIERV